MRIIGGKYRSKRIAPPTNLLVRPTTDRAKEGLFNILNNKIDFNETLALDLFAGTGSISLELVSRGCQHVTAVETNRQCCDFIRKIFHDMNANATILQRDVFAYLNEVQQTFSLIFADPPYNLEKIRDIPELIFANNLLLPGGILVVEHGKQTHYSQHPQFTGQRNYGSVNFSIFYNL